MSPAKDSSSRHGGAKLVSPDRTMSGIPLQPVYEPAGGAPPSLGRPGEYPFTRGPYPTMYRGKPWTMRMFAGFGTPEQTNERFKVLLGAGQTGLSTAFDMPTLMGRDPDDAMSLGEVGREGVSVASLDDMERLFAGIPLDMEVTNGYYQIPFPLGHSLIRIFEGLVASKIHEKISGASKNPEMILNAGEISPKDIWMLGSCIGLLPHRIGHYTNPQLRNLFFHSFRDIWKQNGG